MTYANASVAPPARLAVDFQPYGPFVLEQLRWGEYNGAPTLSGTVVEGSETSRLFHCTSTRSIVGNHRTIYGVTQAEAEAGRCVRIAA